MTGCAPHQTLLMLRVWSTGLLISFLVLYVKDSEGVKHGAWMLMMY